MTLLDSLLDAILRLDGEALVMHAGEKPYVVLTSESMSTFRGPLSWGQVELSSRPLTTDAVFGMLAQMLSPEQSRALDELGAIEQEIDAPGDSGERFVVTAARGGEDVWVEVRRRPKVVAAVPVVEVPEAPAAIEAEQRQLELVAEPQPAGLTRSEPEPTIQLLTDEEVHEISLLDGDVHEIKAIEEDLSAFVGEAAEAAPIFEIASMPGFTIQTEAARVPDDDEHHAGVFEIEAGATFESDTETAPVFEISHPPAPRTQQDAAPVLDPHAEEIPVMFEDVAEEPAIRPAASAGEPRPDITELEFALDGAMLAPEPPLAPMTAEPELVAREEARPTAHAAERLRVTEQNVAGIAEQRVGEIAEQKISEIAQQKVAEIAERTVTRVAEQTVGEIADQRVSEAAHQKLSEIAQQTVAQIAERQIAGIAQQTVIHAAEHKVGEVAEQRVSEAATQKVNEIAEQRVTEIARQKVAEIAQQSVSGIAEQEVAEIAQRLAAVAEQKVTTVAEERVAEIAVEKVTEAAQQQVAEIAGQKVGEVAERTVREIAPSTVRAVAEQRIAELAERNVAEAAQRQVGEIVAQKVAEAAQQQVAEIAQQAVAGIAEQKFAELVAEKAAATAGEQASAAAADSDLASRRDPEPEPVPVVVPYARPSFKLYQSPLPSGGPAASEEAALVELLRVAAAERASMLYAVVDTRPMIRVEGHISLMGTQPSVAAGDVERFIFEFAPREQVADTAPEWACQVPGVGRVRCVTFHDHSGAGLIFHLPGGDASTADELGIPAELRTLCDEADGLIVVSGPRSSGKSTLLSAFVDLINRTRYDHVITIESEIRHVHDKRLSFISQREVRGDGDAIAAAARAALREGPDVLVIEDLRAPEALIAALDAARAGRLVFGSISARTAPAAVERLIDSIPADRRSQIRALLAGSLRAVIAQLLLAKAAGGRVAAQEVLLSSPAVRKVVLDGGIEQLAIAIESGRGVGMKTMVDSLGALVREGVVDIRDACAAAPDRRALISALERDGIDVTGAERRA